MKYLFVMLFLPAPLLHAELPDSVATPKIVVHAVRLTEQIVLDGKLTESVWQNEYGVTEFYELNPVEGGKPSQRAIVRVAYDDAAMYVGAKIYDTAPDSIIARLGRRDVSTNSDRFNVYFDAYHDKRSGFYFGVNAAGTQYDGVLLNDDWSDDTWDGVWESKVLIDGEGWTVEMRIPFSQLRFQQSDKYVWGINFSRDIPRHNEQDYIAFTPKNGSGFVSRFVDLTGIEQIVPPRQMEVLPYVTTKAEYLQHDAKDPFNNGSRYSPRLGGDLKVGLGSNLTLNATVNPDFGQVEVDPAVVNLSDVETSFDEKRPFFVEGSSIFNFGQGGSNNNWGFNWNNLNFLYTRRIGRAPQGSIPSADFVNEPTGTDILGAAKLTGKIGDNWNVGTIQAVTSREYAELQTSGVRSRAEVEPLTYYGITRGSKEFNQGSQSLGFISTVAGRAFSDDRLRDEINKDALVFGLDGWTFLDSAKTWVLTGLMAGSRIEADKTQMLNVQLSSRHYFQRPDARQVSLDSSATSLAGYAGRFALNKQKGNFYMNAAFGIISPGFDMNDVGYLSRTDIINGHLVASYRWTTPKDFYRYIELGGAGFRTYDFGGNITWTGLFHFGYIEFPNFYSINWNYAYNPETMNNKRTRGGPLTTNPPGWQFNISPQTDGNRSVVLNLGVYSYQSGWQKVENYWVGVDWRPTSNFDLSFTPELDYDFENSQYIDAFADPLATATFGNRYVFGEMNQTTLSAGIRLSWTFTPKLSLQMYFQPLISAGEYTNFKELAAARTYTFNRYGDGGSTFDPKSFTADPDGAGPAQPLQFSNPDFNIKSIRGNVVLRWEYFAGSTLYLVWTQSRSDQENIGDFEFDHSIKRLFDASPDNIFLVKFSYWWSL